MRDTYEDNGGKGKVGGVGWRMRREMITMMMTIGTVLSTDA